MTEEDDDDKPFKITFQYCNVFVICALNNGELLANYNDMWTKT